MWLRGALPPSPPCPALTWQPGRSARAAYQALCRMAHSRPRSSGSSDQAGTEPPFSRTISSAGAGTLPRGTTGPPAPLALAPAPPEPARPATLAPAPGTRPYPWDSPRSLSLGAHPAPPGQPRVPGPPADPQPTHPPLTLVTSQVPPWAPTPGVCPCPQTRVPGPPSGHTGPPSPARRTRPHPQDPWTPAPQTHALGTRPLPWGHQGPTTPAAGHPRLAPGTLVTLPQALHTRH